MVEFDLIECVYDLWFFGCLWVEFLFEMLCEMVCCVMVCVDMLSFLFDCDCEFWLFLFELFGLIEV